MRAAAQDLDVITYTPGESLPEEQWALPDYCPRKPSGAVSEASRPAALDGLAGLASWRAKIAAASAQPQS